MNITTYNHYQTIDKPQDETRPSVHILCRTTYRGAAKSLAQPGRTKATATGVLMFIYPIYIHNWRNISTIFIYIIRLASNEIFSPSNKIYREVGRAKDLSAPLYLVT
jgi:hypothetical protein